MLLLSQKICRQKPYRLFASSLSFACFTSLPCLSISGSFHSLPHLFLVCTGYHSYAALRLLPLFFDSSFPLFLRLWQIPFRPVFFYASDKGSLFGEYWSML